MAKPPDALEQARAEQLRRSEAMVASQRWLPTGRGSGMVDGMAQEIHVVPNGNRWEVTRSGDPDPIATFDTQAEAIDRGREKAKRDKAELVIHGADGAIREKDSHGNDPRDIPG